MNNSNLKKAVAAGSVALVWSICSLNLFGIVATIISWAINGKPKKNGAKAAGVLYIISLIGSIAFVLMLFTVGGVMGFISAFFERGSSLPLLGFAKGMALFSVFGDALYIAAAAFSLKAAGELDDSSGENGFFD